MSDCPLAVIVGHEADTLLWRAGLASVWRAALTIRSGGRTVTTAIAPAVPLGCFDSHSCGRPSPRHRRARWSRLSPNNLSIWPVIIDAEG
jgi:hypothetical protein